MEILDKQQVLSELGIAERTLENWVKQQRFPVPVQLGRRVCWTREALEHWKRLTFAYQLEFQPCRRGSCAPPDMATPTRRRAARSGPELLGTRCGFCATRRGARAIPLREAVD